MSDHYERHDPLPEQLVPHEPEQPYAPQNWHIEEEVQSPEPPPHEPAQPPPDDPGDYVSTSGASTNDDGSWRRPDDPALPVVMDEDTTQVTGSLAVLGIELDLGNSPVNDPHPVDTSNPPNDPHEPPPHYPGSGDDLPFQSQEHEEPRLSDHPGGDFLSVTDDHPLPDGSSDPTDIPNLPDDGISNPHDHPVEPVHDVDLGEVSGAMATLYGDEAGAGVDGSGPTDAGTLLIVQGTEDDSGAAHPPIDDPFITGGPTGDGVDTSPVDVAAGDPATDVEPLPVDHDTGHQLDGQEAELAQSTALHGQPSAVDEDAVSPPYDGETWDHPADDRPPPHESNETHAEENIPDGDGHHPAGDQTDVTREPDHGTNSPHEADSSHTHSHDPHAPGEHDHSVPGEHHAHTPAVDYGEDGSPRTEGDVNWNPGHDHSEDADHGEVPEPEVEPSDSHAGDTGDVPMETHEVTGDADHGGHLRGLRDDEIDGALERDVQIEGKLLEDLGHYFQQPEALAKLREKEPHLRSRPGPNPDNLPVNPEPAFQAAHIVPVSSLRVLPTYDPKEAVIRMLPTGRGHAHTIFDQHWQRACDGLIRDGRETMTASEMSDILADAALNSGAFGPAEGATMAALATLGLFTDEGIGPDDLLRIPGRRR